MDERIAAAPAGLQPVLRHLSALVHEAVPEAREAIKWGRVFFEMETPTGKKALLANIGSFREHCSFGFWSPTMDAVLTGHGISGREGAGSFGRIISVDDLPPHATMIGLLREAADHIRTGHVGSSLASKAAPRRSLPGLPAALQVALDTHPTARANFDALPPSCRREYIEWIASAKKPDTAQRRVSSAVASLAAGKRWGQR